MSGGWAAGWAALVPGRCAAGVTFRGLGCEEAAALIAMCPGAASSAVGGRGIPRGGWSDPRCASLPYDAVPAAGGTDWAAAISFARQEGKRYDDGAWNVWMSPKGRDAVREACNLADCWRREGRNGGAAWAEGKVVRL